ncbi:hypothetical protein ACLIOZ_001396 [Klebsiella pneumoniae]
MKFLMFVAPCAAVITKPTSQKAMTAMKPVTKLSVKSAVSKALIRTALTTAARITLMTDITELALITKIKNQLKNFDTVVLKEGEALALVEALEKAQAINAAAEKLVRCKGRYHSELNYRALASLFGVTTPDLPPLDGEPVGEVIEVGDALLVEWHKNLEEGAKLYTAPQAPVMPFGLHPDTQKLVTDFCTALAEKLYKAQLKYGYDTDWKQDGWPSQCQAHFHQHIAKGDPRDVAAYCAFMWWHGWSTKPAEGLESRTVTVKLPDYRNTYKGPFADEVEHQVRLALELFSTAAGIKWEAE